MIAPKIKQDSNGKQDGFETKEFKISEVSEEQMKIIRDQSTIDDFALELPVDVQATKSPPKLVESTSPPPEEEIKKDVQKEKATTT